ncbi:MAG: DinB family protein [Crocinitomicaceae bacterium]
MKIEKQTLLNDLVEMTKNNIGKANQLLNNEFDILNLKEGDDIWSALECVEHLNRYAKFYTPELKTVLDNAKKDNDPIFRAGWIGNYFAKSMLHKPKLNKMKTFRDMNPSNSRLELDVISAFIEYQKDLLDILSLAESISLTKNRTCITISKILKLRIGDTLRVVVYHNERHLIQAIKATVSN